MKDMQELLRASAKALAAKNKAPVMDGACGDGDKEEGERFDSAEDYTTSYLATSAIGAIQQWAETDDLDEGETSADRLVAMMVGVVDANKDGEISDDEQGLLDVALNAAWDYLSGMGASDEDISLLLNDWDADAADRIRDLVASVLPEGDDAASEAIDAFVFGAEDQEPVMDAVYRKTIAVRKGKKVRISKRIAGTVRLSAKQKVAIRKAGMKSHSAAAMTRRMKSMRVRKASGL